MPTISDKDFSPHWVELAQQGDEQAQRAIYLHFAPQVYRLARHMLQCEASAEEVVQECFVNVLCKIESFRYRGSFAGWLRRMAVNQCLMLLRSHWVKKRQVIDETHILEANAWERDAQESIDDTAQSELNRVLAQLPAQTRAVLWLHDVEDYTHREIAKLMGKSVSFSKSQLARAHEKIRQQLTFQSCTGEEVMGEGVRTCMPLLNNY